MLVYLSILILYLRICLGRGWWILEIRVGLTMVEGDWDGGTCSTKREAKEMNMRARYDAGALETVSVA